MNAEEIFIAAIEASSDRERREYVNRMCPDAACAAEVESSVQAHEQAGSFLQEPFIETLTGHHRLSERTPPMCSSRSWNENHRHF